MEKIKLEPYNKGKLLEGMYNMTDTIKEVSDNYLYSNMMYNLHRAHGFHIDIWNSLNVAAPDEEKRDMDESTAIGHTSLGLKKLIRLMKRWYISPDDVSMYYKALLEERGIYEVYMTGEPLATSFRYATHCNIYDYQLGVLIKHDPTPYSHTTDELIKSARSNLFDISRDTSNLMIELDSDFNDKNNIEYQKKIMIVWLQVMRYLHLVGYEPKSLYTTYEKTNS